MKRCPSCQRTYEDNTQAFCFTDGARLVEDSNPAYDRTLVAPPPTVQSEQPQQYYPQGGQSYPSSGPSGPTPPYSTQGNQQQQSWQQPSGQQAWPPPAAQPVAPPQAAGWGAPQPTPPPFQQGAPYAATQTAEGRRRNLAIASLVLGILSIQNALFMRLYIIVPHWNIRTITLLIALSGLSLGAVALILSLTNSTRFAARAASITAVITSFLALLIAYTLRPTIY